MQKGDYVMLFCYSRPNMLIGHQYTDDVAICEANTKEEAIDIFSQMYSMELLDNNVKKVEYNDLGIFVATDY